uniref:Cytochrome b n=2 Tax=unclassified Hiatella TaxID=2619785 RepID=A0AA51UIA9_9BIVA|nr:cytochrome b [Hiatella sp. J HML-2015]WMW23651.1 cytochrome b [Hiatella sp. J YW-2023]
MFWDSPAPMNLNWGWNYGSLLGFTLVVQIISGLILSLFYVPGSLEDAFDSVQFIERDVNGGWVLRGIHMSGASSFFLYLYCHVGRGLYFGSYDNKKTWSMGVLILLLCMLEGFLGYVLPAGQMSYWGATVICNFLTVIPLVGETLLEYVLGGYSVSGMTLKRFFVVHFLAPFLIAIMVVFHLLWAHEKGASNPLGASPNEWSSLAPGFLYKDLVGLFLGEVAVMVTMSMNSWVYMEPTNFIMANPMYTPVHIQPEWYFLFAYSILRCVDTKTGGVILMLLSVLSLLVPMAWSGVGEESNYSGGLHFYPLCKMWYWMFVGTFLGLTFLGSQPPEEPFKMLSRYLTVFYFSFFLLLPLVKSVDNWCLKVSLSGERSRREWSLSWMEVFNTGGM